MKKLIIAICVLFALSMTAFAQTRIRRSTPQRTPKPAVTDVATQAAKTEGATRVATQIKNLTIFLYLLGGVAKEVEALDAAEKTGQPSPTTERHKAQLKASFEDFRVGLDQLEVYFRSTPALQPYYAKLVGSASGAANAEAQASAGHFTQAGRNLISVVGRLADVLVGMR
jgi:hypothetical protein